MPAAIETVALSKRFRHLDAVASLTVDVPAGSAFALIGPNGAGKTTTIKLLMNLLRPSAGRARVLGVDSRALGAAHFRRIGYVSENQDVPSWMTTRQLLEYVRPLYPAWDAAFCEHLRSALGLDLDTRLRRLSRGTRMKAVLLSSLAFRPELIVLDEPFTGLDPLVRDELVGAIGELRRTHPCTVFISSHDIDETERLADWVGFIDQGRLVFAEPVHVLTARVRLVEVTAQAGSPEPPRDPAWLMQGTAGTTLGFIDTRHDAASFGRIQAAWPGASVRVSPLSLREIFVAMAREGSRAARRPEARP